MKLSSLLLRKGRNLVLNQTIKPKDMDFSLDRNIKQYKECCYRAYAYGLASLSIVTSASYFGLTYALKHVPIRSKYLVLMSGLLGSVAGYNVSKVKSKECNLILKAHRDSLKISEDSSGQDASSTVLS